MPYTKGGKLTSSYMTTSVHQYGYVEGYFEKNQILCLSTTEKKVTWPMSAVDKKGENDKHVVPSFAIPALVSSSNSKVGDILTRRVFQNRRGMSTCLV